MEDRLLNAINSTISGHTLDVGDKLNALNVTTKAVEVFMTKKEKMEYDIKTMSEEMKNSGIFFARIKRNDDEIKWLKKKMDTVKESTVISAIPMWIICIICLISVIPLKLFGKDTLSFVMMIIPSAVGFPAIIAMSSVKKRRIKVLQNTMRKTEDIILKDIGEIMDIYRRSSQVFPVKYTYPKIIDDMIYCSKFSNVETLNDVIEMVCKSERNTIILNRIDELIIKYVGMDNPESENVNCVPVIS